MRKQWKQFICGGLFCLCGWPALAGDPLPMKTLAQAPAIDGRQPEHPDIVFARPVDRTAYGRAFLSSADHSQPTVLRVSQIVGRDCKNFLG
jgi:hypothetical protein